MVVATVGELEDVERQTWKAIHEQFVGRASPCTALTKFLLWENSTTQGS